MIIFKIAFSLSCHRVSIFKEDRKVVKSLPRDSYFCSGISSTFFLKVYLYICVSYIYIYLAFYIYSSKLLYLFWNNSKLKWLAQYRGLLLTFCPTCLCWCFTSFVFISLHIYFSHEPFVIKLWTQCFFTLNALYIEFPKRKDIIIITIMYLTKEISIKLY